MTVMQLKCRCTLRSIFSSFGDPNINVVEDYRLGDEGFELQIYAILPRYSQLY